MLTEWKDKPFFEDVSLLSEEEYKILKAIREPSVKSVTVKKLDGEPELLEKVVEGSVELGTRFMDVIVRHGYQDVTIKARNGKLVHFENKILEKFKSTK